tara:strand:+ start:660 stop:857 length:198 start_codon:yes stop_codon:yes gene_type:complete
MIRNLKMKATMNKEEYRHFTESLVIIKEKAGIDIAHTVEYQGDNFIVEILDDVSLEGLDEILESK